MEYLSYSRLSLYETCGLRFYYEYVAHATPTDEVPTHYTTFGKLLHALYEDHANSSGEKAFDELKSTFDQQFPAVLDEFPDRKTAVEFYKNGIRAIHRFSGYKVSDVVASEQEFLLPMAPGVPPIKGFIDRVIYSPKHGYMVADLKTGKTFSAQNPKKMYQLVIYSAACESIYGKPADSGYFDFIVSGQREWVDITEAKRDQAKQWVAQTWRKIEEERFDAKYSSGFCSRFCPFRSMCGAYQERQTHAEIASGHGRG
ncbi:MAG: PD-(D/E)XK nuclease family protein [Acidibacillus sp.]|uniref:PD-(D/E)XK endonuclease-like domain-containing protein n=1 Tax=Sulfoacidibacillus ferrooxidans TaxID=2005001 RepID=A0A9X2ABP4_9BACL|nr:PD-(D/E)XK nuclease family protein [Sulfoacidibacillus ferrooxidans]MCI0183263.1 hypothetical protein [Sulfoacidibacillus ferrooxidans]MCY0893794.1 PD-(D/E)XK nuclease family protein [Acidibacillus sp.]